MTYVYVHIDRANQQPCVTKPEKRGANKFVDADTDGVLPFAVRVVELELVGLKVRE